MASKMGYQSKLSIGGTDIPYVTSIDISEDIDNAMSNLMNQPHKKVLTGNQSTILTANLELPTGASGVTLWGTTLARGASGAIIYQPFGTTTGDVKITSTKGTVLGRTQQTPVNGIIAATVTIQLDDYTVAANS